MSRSVSTADNGEETQVIGAAVVVEGIRLLSLMRLPPPNAIQYLKGYQPRRLKEHR